MSTKNSCPLCYELVSKSLFTFKCPDVNSMVPGQIAQHTICMDCAVNYFNTKIKERDTNVCCPLCLQPNMQVNSKESREYISWLLTKLQMRLSITKHEILKEMVHERELSFDLNYRRCQECDKGFIAKSTAAGSMSCTHCENELVDQMANMKVQQETRATTLALTEMRKSNVWFKCDRCKAEFIVEPPLECLRMVCRCSYESCRGCKLPFVRDSNSPACRKLQCTYRGLHCHHPRYCANYLRDFSVAQLTSLLIKAGVDVTVPTIRRSGVRSSTDCTPCTGYDFNGSETMPCRNPVVYKAYQCCVTHSQLYLAELVRKHRIDPLPIMDAKDCMQEIRRLRLEMPYRGPYDDDTKYQVICASFLRAYPLYD